MTEAPAQIPLDLPVRAARDRENFCVSASNALALAELDRWRAWPLRRLALAGPEGAGKTHLAAVWSQDTGAARIAAADLAALDAAEPGEDARRGDAALAPDLRALLGQGALAVEDADRLAGDPAGERALFHLINLAAEARCALLLTARSAPARWGVRLPDLASRLAATAVARLDPPDDALLEGLVKKLLDDRQIRGAAGSGLPRYLVRHGPRSHHGLAALVEEIDRAALARRRRPNVSLASEILRAQAQADDVADEGTNGAADGAAETCENDLRAGPAPA